MNIHDDDSMEVDALSRKGNEKGKFGKGKKGGKKGKENHTGKGYGEQNQEKPSYIKGERRNCGKYGDKAADCWHKQPKPQGKGKATSKVVEVSENSEHVEDTWTPVSSPQPSSSSQVNTIRDVGCGDEGLWIFSLEDSAKHRQTVSWDESWPEIYEQADEHELMIDSGCFGHDCPPGLAPQLPVVSASNVAAEAANDAALQHFGH